MISTWLAENTWFAPTALGVVVVAGLLVGLLVVHHRRWAWAATGAALLPVLALTLSPGPRPPYELCAMSVFLPSPTTAGDLPNLALFVAPGLFCAIASRRPLAALIGCSAFSAAIEVLQAAVPALHRACDANDWVYNSVGAVVGVALAWLVLRSSGVGRPRR